MAVITGDKFILKANTSAFTKISEGKRINNLQSFDWTDEYSTESTASIGSTMETFARAIKKNSFSGTMKLNPTDEGQKILIDNSNGKTDSFYLLIQPDKSVSLANVYKVFVSKFSKKVSYDKSIEVSVEFQIMEEPTELTTP